MKYDFFMNKALEQAGKALRAGEFPVGCVIVYNDKIISSGSRTGTSNHCKNETDHAEMIALRNFADKIKNINPRETTLFCTLEPCLMCFGASILSGIGTIVYAYEDIMGGATCSDLTKLPVLYRNANISIISGILRDKSLELFKRYFSDPENSYWQGSILADYTLKQ